MGKNRSLVKNMGWQMIYQFIATCMPLITAPYLSRILGAGKIGVFSYTYSLALFFRMFGLLGNEKYGTREIAKVRNNVIQRTRLFKEILSVQTVATLISLIAYFLYCLLFEANDTINYIQSIWIIDCFVNISWFYSGIEDFKYKSLRGIAIKIFQLVTIILFVKNENHVGRYAFIMAFSAVLSNLILWFGIGKKIDIKTRISFNDVKKHVKPIFVLFIPVAAASVFQLMDKLMLGKMSTSVQSGYYYNSDHLVNIPILVITGLCTVMLSRMSYVGNDEKKFSFLFDTYSEIILIVAVAMASGIGAIAREFVPFFFGSEFSPCVELVYIFVFIMIIKSVSCILMSMYLIPKGKDKTYVYAVVIGAIFNAVFNTLFIAFLKMGALGATLGTLIAEFTVMTAELILIRKQVKIWTIISKVFPYMLIGGIMFIIVRLSANILKSINPPAVIMILAEIIIGAISYCIIAVLFLLATKRFSRVKNGLLGGH